MFLPFINSQYRNACRQYVKREIVLIDFFDIKSYPIENYILNSAFMCDYYEILFFESLNGLQAHNGPIKKFSPGFPAWVIAMVKFFR